MKIFMLFLILINLFMSTSCDNGALKRNPASEEILISDKSVASGNIKLQTLSRGLQDLSIKSEMIKSIDYLGLDPLTGHLNIKLSVNYPLESLFSFTSIPETNLDSIQEIDMSVSFPKTEQLAKSRYFGVQFHKFKINGEDYINAFEIVLGVVKTVLANSELFDYLWTKSKDQIQDLNSREVLKEMLESNSIVAFHTSKKINFKLDINRFSFASNYIDDYDQLRLWRFSPNYYRSSTQEVSFKFVLGEGEPSPSWLDAELAEISSDHNLILEARENVYREYSNSNNFMMITNEYLGQLLANEKIEKEKLSVKYQREIESLINELKSEASETLNLENDLFRADPEFEYSELLNAMRNKLRLFVSNLDRKMSIDEQIIAGGVISNAKPIMTELISQHLLNSGINTMIDTEVEGVQFLDEIQLWLLPHQQEIQLRGKFNVPLDFILGKLDSSLIGTNIESKLIETDEGIPFKLTLQKYMLDNGVLGLEIKRLKLFEASKEISFNYNSSNSQFLIDLTKMFISESLVSVKYELDDEIDQERLRIEEMNAVLNYVSQLKELYSKEKDLSKFLEVFKSDISLNPFITAGEEHVRKKRNILLGDVVKYNPINKLLEIKVDPSIVIDKVNNTRHNLQVWNISPIHSKELSNNFLEISVGHGRRSQSYVREIERRNNSLESIDNNNIYYELGRDQLTVDMLTSVNFDYLELYINQFLRDMTLANQTNIAEQARNNKGETFYEIEELKLNITQAKQIELQIKVKSAKLSNWRASWNFWEDKLSEDSYTLRTVLHLSSKLTDTNNRSQNLTNLTYHPEAISINPTQIRVTAGSPSLMQKAMLGLVNGASRLALNNSLVKKVLMKVANTFLRKMYTKKDGVLLGHEMEKYVRIVTTNNDILLYLNPRLSGPAFDLKLTSEEKWDANENEAVYKAVRIDPSQQMLHAAFTASFAMAKADKKELIDIFMGIQDLLAPILKANSKSELEALLSDGQLSGKLLTNTDKSKMALYQRYLRVLRKYDQVLHSVNIPHSSSNMKNRISATGSELMYFASISYMFQLKLAALITQMDKYNLKNQRYYYPTYVDSQSMIERNITNPLISQYRSKHFDINKTILNNPISYWTYLFYPDAYFADAAFIIMNSK